MPGRTVVVHATDLLVRSFQAVPPDRRDREGRIANALYGVALALLRVGARKQPDRAIAVLEASAPDASWPRPLAEQHARLGTLLDAHGFTWTHVEDALRAAAAAVEQAVEAGHEVVVVGADKRLAQLVRPGVWWYEQHKDLFSTEDIVRKRFGVPPSWIGDFLGLVGERDLLDGVPGVGKKSAIELLEAHGSLAAALQVLDDLPSRVRKALRNAGDQATAEVARATLRGGSSPFSMDDGAFEPPAREALNATYQVLGFTALLQDVPQQAIEVPVVRGEALAVWLSRGPEPVAVELVTEGPSPVRGAWVGVGLARGPDDAIYVDVREEVDAILASWLADPVRRKLVHGASDLMVTGLRHDIDVAGVHLDTGTASHLDDPVGRAPHDLERVVRAVLRRALVPVEAVCGKGKGAKPFSEVEPAMCAGWAGGRAVAIAELAPRFGEPGPHHAFALQLSETLAAMQARGIACRPERLDEAEAWLSERVERLQGEVHDLAGHSFNLGSSKQLSKVLFEELGLNPPIRTKTGFSTATDVLARIQDTHAIVPRVMAWRQHRRLIDAWVTALRPAVDSDGRVRARQHLARSFFGRVLCSDPDLSRVPGRTEAMSWIRRAFAPPEGRTLLSIDYAQLGLVVLAHLSGDPKLAEPIRSGADLHRITASALFEVAPEAVTDDQRQVAKAVNFATFNGQGSSALAAQLGIEVPEARTFISRFNDYYSIARAYQESQLDQARTTGEVTSWSGRRWRVGGLQSLEIKDRAYAERLARRAAIEGTVADVARLGLRRVDLALQEAGLVARPLVQVHDEILFEVPDDELMDTVRVGCHALEAVAQFDVPLRVGAKAGPDWASLEAVARP
ncbi:MAG: DNA polymerase [Myxococcota bacterium]